MTIKISKITNNYVGKQLRVVESF